MKKNFFYTIIPMLASIYLTGCQHQLVAHAAALHNTYNSSIAEASSNEILLNIARAYNHEAPSFLAISSITTSNSYTTPGLHLEQDGFSGSNLLASTVGSITTNGMSYNPNITMTPNSGEQYANQLLTPLSLKDIGQISYAQNNIGLLLRLTIAKLGPWTNYPPIPMEHNPDQVIQNEKNFQAFCDMIQEVFANNGHILFFKRIDESKQSSLKNIALYVPIKQPYRFTQKQLELLKSLKMNPKSKHFKLSLNLDREPNTIAITPRTLVSTLHYLSNMIEGAPHPASIQSMQALLSKNFITIKTSQGKPENPFIAVQQHNLWYYIDNNDIQSKTTFESLELLFDITRIIPKNNSTVLISN